MFFKNDNDYQHLLSQWSNLEAGLGILLLRPQSAHEFAQRIPQYDRWLQALLDKDTDVGLYLLFQLATNSTVGYSASHALICSALCHLIAKAIDLEPYERDRLVRAALTMNVAMTALQDQLAVQTEKLNREQQAAVAAHPAQGRELLIQLGIQDQLWLDVVAGHHDKKIIEQPLDTLPAVQRLVRILHLVDRYAAMISPRKSRNGRSSMDSARQILQTEAVPDAEVGSALIRTVGLCPPGTYVRLDDNAIAVVVRRSPEVNQPFVAIVTTTREEPLPQPILHRTVTGLPAIQAALPAGQVKLRLNHLHILHMGAQVRAG